MRSFFISLVSGFLISGVDVVRDLFLMHHCYFVFFSVLMCNIFVHVG